MPGRRARVHLGHRREDGAVEVAVAEERQHVVLEDRLALLVRQVRHPEAGAGIELDLAVAPALVEVEQDDHPVVEALAPDAPLVDQGNRVLLGQLGRVALGLDLGVDDDLGTRPRLDVAADLLGPRDRGRRQDARRVVDALTGHGLWIWRPGRGGTGGEEHHGDQPGDRGQRSDPDAAQLHRPHRTCHERPRPGADGTCAGALARIRRTSSAACS